VDLAFDQARRKAFGGWTRAAASTVAETIFSTLHAPLQMLWHTGFVATILSGTGVNWSSQKRSADGTSWGYAIRRHWGHTLIGVIWGVLAWQLDRTTFWWFVPVLAGMVCSIPLSVVTSRRDYGLRAQQSGLFLTPEETSPPWELAALRTRMVEPTLHVEPSRENSAIADAVLDPYVNAIHVSLQRELRLNPGHNEMLKKLSTPMVNTLALGETLLATGPDALSQEEKLLVLSDANAMAWLHKRAWLQPGETLAPWWQKAIRQYSR
jgi:membrane glycosyltransferase